MNDTFHIADLIVRKIRGTITPRESDELEEWINENPDNLSIYHRATDRKNQLDKLEIYNLFRKEKVWARLEEELFPTKTIRLSPQKVLRYAASILLPLLVAGGVGYMLLNKPAQETFADLDEVIKPGSQKAVLILADGGTIELEPGQSMADFHEGDALIRNENNLLTYSVEDTRSSQAEMIYNELKTPRGGGYNIKLSDGTGVWLNAGSSLRFPVSFSDSTRRVFLEGEAYFEVTHNGTPFIVNAEDMDVSVLGTSFNVSAYSDEPEFKTTLVDGIVSVTYPGTAGSIPVSEILAPNQQAVVNKSGSEISIAEVNTSFYTSWMRGKMEFNNEPLDIVMKRLARWYDFEYEFENSEAKDYHFSARLDKSENISAILEMLQLTTDVKFEARENKIVVY